jgi:hypothetical protein
MDNRLKKIITKQSERFDEWTNLINSYRKDSYSDKKISNEEAINLINEVVNVLFKISEMALEFGNFKDDFERDKFSQNFYGPELIINSKKTKTSYYLGFCEKGLYLSTYFQHSKNLRNMDDKFWIDFLDLSEYGKFELVETEHFGNTIKRKYPDLFQINKGAIFRIFRKYFIGIAENNEVGDLGQLQVSWTPGFSIDKIIEECCLVFKIFYKLNYSLWKIDDLKSKKKI